MFKRLSRRSSPESLKVEREYQRTPRSQLVVQIECWGKKSASCLGRTLNFSEDGLLMTAPDSFEPGTQVEIRFTVPGEGRDVTIQAKGAVVRTDPGRSMAIQFTKLNNSDREAITQFLKSGLSF
jgi:hypothetical protein